MIEDLQGGIELLELAIVEHRDAIGQRHGFELIVGDDDGRKSLLGMKALDLRAHLDAQRGIKVTQRFIQQQHSRPADQGARNVDALLLAATQCRRLEIEQFFHVKILGDFGNSFVDLLPA